MGDNLCYCWDPLRTSAQEDRSGTVTVYCDICFSTALSGMSKSWWFILSWHSQGGLSSEEEGPGEILSLFRLSALFSASLVLMILYDRGDWQA